MNINSDLRQINKKRSAAALTLSVLVVALVFVGLVIKLTAPITEENPDEGLRAFKYFTVLSNILCASCIALTIPFQVDGLRYGNYHLPRWAVYALYIGVTGVAVTLVVALCFLAPTLSFHRVFIAKAGFFHHLSCPVLSILLFMFINDDHHISFRWSVVSLIPLFVYGILYYIMVFVIGDESGGWRDHYHLGGFLPMPVTALLVFAIGLLISNGLRLIHNRNHAAWKKTFEAYYMESPEFDFPDIRDAVLFMAEQDKKRDSGGEITVPRRAIKILMKRYQSDVTLKELCETYCNGFVDE